MTHSTFSLLRWIDANKKLPPRDRPVVVAVDHPTAPFVATSHRMQRAWSGISAPANVILWAELPPYPTIENDEPPTA